MSACFIIPDNIHAFFPTQRHLHCNGERQILQQLFLGESLMVDFRPQKEAQEEARQGSHSRQGMLNGNIGLDAHGAKQQRTQ